MPTRRIGDLPKFNGPSLVPSLWSLKPDGKLPCQHPEHFQAKHIVREPGIYEHTCPACGQRFVFSVPVVTYSGELAEG